ncbi:MAG: D-alanyl-D-alanine carboxypeptidase/D-alanyl-D-alanine-endopeptidase [Spirochaetes bacterium RBG_13_51_14]|nr:MAG: D-alanyl-D-alanine carboxypeptidase/D-alanyl-D-alanine-endopeptidase [Spirochaetes bacterium RBG_13_51_14]
MPLQFFFKSIAMAAAPILIAAGCGFRPVDVDVSFGPGKPADGAEMDLIKNMPPDNIGFILYDLERKSVVKIHNRSRAFIPASTTKVFTTVAAMNVLGPDYRFGTRISYRGSISGGTLKGDLYLKGTGDPLLTVADLMDMSDAMKKKGIASVSGRFYYDESDLASTVSIDGDMEPDVSFNPGVSALSLDYNSISAEWKRDRERGAMDIFLTPSLPINHAGLSAEKLRENITFAYQNRSGTESWFLSPDKDTDGIERLPVKKPALYTAYMFSTICGMRGIRLPRPEPGTEPGCARTIAYHESSELTDIADLTLTFSINLAAELMMLTTAKKITGEKMNLADSAKTISAYFSDRLESVSWRYFRIINGSGLTAKNRITPEQMVAVLAYADAQNYSGRKYRSCLPASGWEWSLMNRLNDPETAFHVWAKTGSINYALALAGYLYTKSSRSMAFAIFVNDIAKRERYDADPDRRSSASARRVNTWLKNSKTVMDHIVTGWITEL